MSDGGDVPWVRDEVTGRVGTLMFSGLWRDPVTRREVSVAFIRPVGGGREWAARPEQVRAVEPVGEGR